MPQHAKRLTVVPREPGDLAVPGAPAEMAPAVGGRGRGRGRRVPAALTIGSLVVLILAANLAAVWFLWAYYRESAPPPLPETPTAASPRPAVSQPVRVAWQPPGAAVLRLVAVDDSLWQRFIADRQAAREAVRTAVLQDLRANLRPALAPVFEDMRSRIPEYLGWLYFFPTTYRMAAAAVIGLLSQEADDSRPFLTVAADSMNAVMQEQFVILVIAPRKYRPAVEDALANLLQAAEAKVRAARAADEREVAAFLGPRGQAGIAAEGAPVVLASAALGRADIRPLALPPEDPVDQIKGNQALTVLQASVWGEGLMLATRQVVRRTVGSVVGSTLQGAALPLLPGAGLGGWEGLATPVLGFAAFAVGVGAEWGTIKLRQMVEQDGIVAQLNQVIDRVRDSETDRLGDLMLRHVDAWMAER